MRKLRRVLALVLALAVCLGATAFAAEADRETVRQVQQALNDAGYNCGKADGIAGKKTIAAIQQFQTDRGLEATGVVDDALLAALGLAKEVPVVGARVAETPAAEAPAEEAPAAEMPAEEAALAQAESGAEAAAAEEPVEQAIEEAEAGLDVESYYKPEAFAEAYNNLLYTYYADINATLDEPYTDDELYEIVAPYYVAPLYDEQASGETVSQEFAGESAVLGVDGIKLGEERYGMPTAFRLSLAGKADETIDFFDYVSATRFLLAACVILEASDADYEAAFNALGELDENYMVSTANWTPVLYRGERFTLTYRLERPDDADGAPIVTLECLVANVDADVPAIPQELLELTGGIPDSLDRLADQFSYAELKALADEWESVPMIEALVRDGSYTFADPGHAWLGGTLTYEREQRSGETGDAGNIETVRSFSLKCAYSDGVTTVSIDGDRTPDDAVNAISLRLEASGAVQLYGRARYAAPDAEHFYTSYERDYESASVDIVRGAGTGRYRQVDCSVAYRAGEKTFELWLSAVDPEYRQTVWRGFYDEAGRLTGRASM